MELLILGINKREQLLGISLVVLLFLFLNPIYALFLCAFLNWTNLRINYWIFSFMFVISFSLFYYLKDYSPIFANPTDIFGNVERFKTISYLSWSDIIFRFINSPGNNEAFFWLYVKLVNTLFLNNESFFVFFQYVISFVLIACLGKIIDANKFVIIILCILFTNFSVISNIYEVWRHTMAYFIFLIGVFSFDVSTKKWLPRILIYSSALFHIGLLPLIVCYEIFTLFNIRIQKNDFIKLFSKEVILYTISIFLGFIILFKYASAVSQIFLLYEKAKIYFEFFLDANIYNYQILFNSFTFLICMYLWKRKNKLTKADVFIATSYLIITLVVIELAVPAVFGRYIYFIMIGGGILIGKLIATNLRLGLIIILIFFAYDIYSITYNTEYFLHYFNKEYHNPVFGLTAMIINYDTLLNFNY